MGRQFLYIADESLEAHRDRIEPCPLCGVVQALYPFWAEPEGGLIDEACPRCIRTLPIDAIWRWKSESRVSAHLRAFCPILTDIEVERRGAEIGAELRRTPRLPPFCQEDEWPLCCGDFAEYVGRPGLPEGWDNFGGLSLFRCHRCGRDHEVFQYT